MKDYLKYSVEDFVTDESYLSYYFRENEEDIRFWTDWVSRHPEKLDVVISANNYIEAFSIRLPDDEFQIEKQRFSNALNETLIDDSPLYVADEEAELEPANVAHQNRMRYKAIAFVIVLVILTCVYLLLFS